MCLLWQLCSSSTGTRIRKLYNVGQKICLPKQCNLDELVNVCAEKCAGNKGPLNKWVHEFSICFLLFSFLSLNWNFLIWESPYKENIYIKVFSINQSINQSVNQPTNQSINKSIFSFNVNSIPNKYIEKNLSAKVQGS